MFDELGFGSARMSVTPKASRDAAGMSAEVLASVDAAVERLRCPERLPCR
jgi:hypothetical protein